jgi:squalene-hopene/tetraprenyl-beta-curcumene cyclase
VAFDPELEAEGKEIHKTISLFYEKTLPAFTWPSGTELVEAGGEGDTDLVKGPDVTAYHYYPFLFAEVFPRVSYSDVRMVALSGQLYAEYLLLRDKLMDDQIGRRTLLWYRTFLYAGFLHEKSLGVLHSLFAPDSSFWQHFTAYHQEFTRSVFREKTRHLGALTAYPKEELHRIAIGKSAMAKASPTALAVLGHDEEKIEPLAASQDLVAIARQLYDDLLDWKKDYHRKSYSYLLTHVIMKHGFEQDVQAGNQPDVKTIGQILYYSGLAEALLDEANNYYREAACGIEGLNCSRWVKYIQHLQQDCQRLRNDLSEIRNKTLTVYQSPSKKKSASLSSALDQAIYFLESGQRPEGYWSDFRNSAGESTEWVTGYVGTALSRVEKVTDTLVRARDWITNKQFPQGGWGYHQGVVVDADSTSWCLLFLASLQSQPEIRSKAVEVLKTHQSHTDGGFRTYLVPDSIRGYMGVSDDVDCSGWCSSQLCVTAVAVLALLRNGLTRNSEEIQGALDYIREQQQDAGYWEAYWWEGRMYSTYHCVKVLRAAGAVKDDQCCQRAVQWLLTTQLEDGSWNNGVMGEGRPFHTALALQALLAVGEESAWQAANRGIRWLLQEQVDDGSWRSYTMLRIPYPWTHYPWKEHLWREENTGTGIIIRDHRRYFTTATVLNALLQARSLG